MQFPYIQQLTQWLRRGYESFVVIDTEQLDANCRDVRSQYPPYVQHLYDLKTLPTLAVVRMVHDILRGHVVVSTMDWMPYVQLAAIPAHETMCLKDKAFWIESVDDWTGLHNGCRPERATVVCIPHTILPMLAQAAAVNRMERHYMRWLVDARSVPANEEGLFAQCVQQFCSRNDIRCAVLHGEALFHKTCTLWLTVRAVKKVHGRRYVILSGGTNLLSDAGQHGNAFRKKYSIMFPQSNEKETGIPSTFCGPLCTPQDLLAADVPAPPLRRGELVAVPDVGNWHYRSPMYFISHPAPLEMLYVHGDLAPVQQITQPHLPTRQTVQ